MRLMRSRLGIGVVLTFGLLFAQTALAESAPVDPESLRHAADEFEAGRRAFRARDFETAAVHFENADRAVPNADTLRIAIRARREAGQLDRAATLAALGLNRDPKHKALRNYAEATLALAEKQLHEVEIHCEPECSVAVDNRVTPYEQVGRAILYLEAGEHSIVAGWSGNRTQARQLEAIAGGKSTLGFEAPPEEPEPTAAPLTEAPEADDLVDGHPGETAELRSSGLPPHVFWAGAGLTAVLGGVTIWSGLDTQANPGPDKVRAECVGQGESCSLYQDGLAKQRRTNILLLSTGVAGVATTLIGIFATDWEGAEKEPPTLGRQLTPVIGFGDGVTVGAVGRF